MSLAACRNANSLNILSRLPQAQADWLIFDEYFLKVKVRPCKERINLFGGLLRLFLFKWVI